MELRRSTGAILDAASAGERILIERDRRPLAYLVSVEEGERLDAESDDLVARRLAALDDLAAFAARMGEKYGPAPDGLSAEEWMRWDRDHRDDPDYYEQLEKLTRREG
jgi:antitoxin (DNA-binding transcriptional repressor) of toxin-antitoxin stability system